MAETRSEIDAAAIAWVIRLREARAEDWEEFAAWLEADPARAEAYEEIAMADRAMGDLPRARPKPILPLPERSPAARPARRAFLGWGIAAALAGTIGYVALRPGADLTTIATGPGERRSVVLADGSRIDVNGSTTLILDEDKPRFARLAGGEALFTIVHDGSRPFTVEAGDARIKDVGTLFNVIYSAEGLEVAVGEGEVLFNPAREAVSLSPGMMLREEGGRVVVARVEARSVGAWRQAQLSYGSATLPRIAADLSRNLGVAVRVDPRLSGRTFSGVIMVDGDQERLFRRVSALLDVKAERSGDGWLLTPLASATP